MKHFIVKSKYVTQTCTFNLSNRTLLPKKINLDDFQTGHLTVGKLSEPVYVQSFDTKSKTLVILCKQGMFEALSKMIGHATAFRLLDSNSKYYTLASVDLEDLCYLKLKFD